MIRLKTKWTALFVSNFLSVFNDNFLKNSVIFIASAWILPQWLSISQLISMVSASLVLPYLFLSPLAGRLSVVYERKSVFIFGKILELPVLLFACVAFYQHWPLLAVLSVLFMGVLSCLYSPSKYSLIRDIGGDAGATYGSSIFEMMAFLGILTGTVVASLVSDLYSLWLFGALLLGLGLLGVLSTLTIRVTETDEAVDNPGTLNPIRFLIASRRLALLHKHVDSAVFGAAAFWLVGSMLQMNLVIHTRQVYQASNTAVGMVMSLAAVGIAFGCWTAGKLSGKYAGKGLILPSIISMCVLFFVLALCPMPIGLYRVVVFIVAFLGGIFQVPNLSIIQHAKLGRRAGQVFAYLNMITFILLLLGSVLFSLSTYLSAENSYVVFASIGVVCLLISCYFLFVSPDFWHSALQFFRIRPRQ